MIKPFYTIFQLYTQKKENEICQVEIIFCAFSTLFDRFLYLISKELMIK